MVIAVFGVLEPHLMLVVADVAQVLEEFVVCQDIIFTEENVGRIIKRVG